MIPTRLELSDIQAAFRDVEHRVKLLKNGTLNLDLNGRRIINAGRAVADFDYVTKFDLSDAIGGLSSSIQSTPKPVGILNAAAAIRTGLFASRGSPVAHANEAFFATDQGYVGWVSTGAAWIYATGYNSLAQSALSGVTALLGTNDAGYLFNVNDFTHMLRWTGSATEFAPGDSGSGYIGTFPIAPPGGTWGLCDGTAYTYLKADGTTASFTTPNYATAAYLKLGTSATIGPTAASGTSSSDSAGTPSGTNATSGDFWGETGGVDNNASKSSHTHIFTGDALAAHSHTANTLELRRTLLTAYFRR